VSSLVNELTNLNKVIEKFDLDHVSKKLEYVSSLEDNIGGFIQHKKKQKSKTHKKKHLSLEKGKVRKTVGFLVNKKQKTRKRRLY
jgi:hypothetical protein